MEVFGEVVWFSYKSQNFLVLRERYFLTSDSEQHMSIMQ